MKISFSIVKPIMPEHITFERPPGTRQQGIKPVENIIPVSELTQEQAVEYSELLKQTFLEHWKNKVSK